MKKQGNIVSYSADELAAMRERGEGRCDWAKVDATTDADLDRLIAEDGEEAPLAADWATALVVGLPKRKQHLNLRIDADVVAWFKGQGKGYQTRMNAVLRAYMEACGKHRLKDSHTR
jgi:uncharacterized protein (DUF4415 family)